MDKSLLQTNLTELTGSIQEMITTLDCLNLNNDQLEDIETTTKIINGLRETFDMPHNTFILINNRKTED